MQKKERKEESEIEKSYKTCTSAKRILMILSSLLVSIEQNLINAGSLPNGALILMDV